MKNSYQRKYQIQKELKDFGEQNKFFNHINLKNKFLDKFKENHQLPVSFNGMKTQRKNTE